MNVSSVKNLNGEVFSAVQDASLTNVVQTNSGNWQDITAYQNASATYLTAHQDLSDYYTTAEAETLSSMLSGAIDYVSANAGDEFPISADEAIQYVQTNSGTIDETVSNVQTNSASWGGDGLPITGRDGIDLEIDNGTLYIGASALTGAVNTYEQNSASYVVENNFEYDGNDLITAYNGSAFAGQGGGGGNPEVENYVVTNSAQIDDTVNNVTTNSGVWGGSALPISAGPGIKVNLVDNTLVFSNDETVIFNGDVSGQITDFNTNEQINDFEKLDVYYCCNDDGFSLLGGNITTYDTNVLTAQNQISLGGTYTISNGYTCFYNLYYTITNGSAFSCTQSKRWWVAPTASNPDATNVRYNPTENTEKKKNGYIYKIVGINRK